MCLANNLKYQPMDFPRLVFSKLSIWERALFFLLIIFFILLIGYLHYLVGMAYEFYLLFLIPIGLVSWFFSRAAAYFVVFFIVVVWGAGDILLMRNVSDKIPLVFNSMMRLMVFLSASWLLVFLRIVFDREVKFAREDGLTGLLNRREFYELGRDALARANRQSIPISIVFLDVDRFKEVNDTFGHDAGDRLLFLVADVAKKSIRSTDIAGRLGGDEFALVLLDLHADSALSFVEKLQGALLDAMSKQGWPATFSIGVASFHPSPPSLEDAMAKADSLMYQVKRNGRNKITQEIYLGDTEKG